MNTGDSKLSLAEIYKLKHEVPFCVPYIKQARNDGNIQINFSKEVKSKEPSDILDLISLHILDENGNEVE